MIRRYALPLLVLLLWTGHQSPAAFTTGEVPTPDGERLYYEKGGSGSRAVILLGRLAHQDNVRIDAGTIARIRRVARSLEITVADYRRHRGMQS